MGTILLLSFIQSMTEFLPVSSSGHLVLAQAFNFSNQSLLVDVALHVGTLLAVLGYFYTDVIALIKGLFIKGPARNLCGKLIIATLPIIVIGFALANLIESVFRSPFIIAFTAIFYGILLWASDRYSPKTKTLDTMRYRDALWIGLAQTLALIPGTSRSGITMTMARALGINRSDSARFSMLLSIPTILLAAGYMALSTWLSPHESIGSSWPILLSGIGFSAFFGLIAVWFLMKWVQKGSFAIFAIYRIILGIFLWGYFLSL